MCCKWSASSWSKVGCQPPLPVCAVCSKINTNKTNDYKYVYKQRYTMLHSVEHFQFSREREQDLCNSLCAIIIYQVKNFVLSWNSFWHNVISIWNVSIVTQFLLPSISPGCWQMHGLVWRRQTLEGNADVSCRIQRSTSGSVSGVLICHKCPLFLMAEDKGQRTYEEHAFLMWHPHQIHHSGLSRMPMTLYSSSNYSETMHQYECKPWRAHLPLTWQSLNTSVLHLLLAWTCELGVVFD